MLNASGSVTKLLQPTFGFGLTVDSDEFIASISIWKRDFVIEIYR